MMNPTTDNRKNLIAKIHIAKKQLGFDEATYRDFLHRATGKDSLKAMELKELKKVMADFKKAGFVATPPKKAPSWGKKPHATADKQSLMGKIEAMLADMNLHWAYANGMAKKMFGVEFVNWLTAQQLYKLTQALAVHQQKRQKANAKASQTQAPQTQTKK